MKLLPLLFIFALLLIACTHQHEDKQKTIRDSTYIPAYYFNSVDFLTRPREFAYHVRKWPYHIAYYDTLKKEARISIRFKNDSVIDDCSISSLGYVQTLNAITYNSNTKPSDKIHIAKGKNNTENSDFILFYKKDKILAWYNIPHQNVEFFSNDIPAFNTIKSYLQNAKDTIKMAKPVPDWYVKEFIDNISVE
jgi:hypothetical protein